MVWIRWSRRGDAAGWTMAWQGGASHRVGVGVPAAAGAPPVARWHRAPRRAASTPDSDFEARRGAARARREREREGEKASIQPRNAQRDRGDAP
jgi:hypothetical protein